MQAQISSPMNGIVSACMKSILVDFEIKTFSPYVLYPLLEDFLVKLNDDELHWHWSEQFFEPLTRMDVWHLDDIDLVTPESLHTFYKLPPIMIMDFFSCILEGIQTIHRA